MPRPTHYEILGVAPSADVTEIRGAYRRLAREHHPDRAASTGSNDAAMPAINEAYRVLNDQARRAVYDAGLRGAMSVRGPAAPANDSDPSPATPPTMFPSRLGPARVPWRSMLFFGTIGIIGVVVLAQFTDPGVAPGPDGIIEIGSCVSIEPNGDAREVACTTDPTIDLVIEAFVPFDAQCPTGTEPHRDRQGMGVACVGVMDET